MPSTSFASRRATTSRQPRRATFVVTGKVLCEVELEADYDALAVSLGLVNVRRIGRRQCRITAERAADLADELARYLMGVDDDLERCFAK